MCGICGYVHLAPAPGVYDDVLRKMANRLRHRGPDDQGCFVDTGAGLANTRLSVVDVAGGHQPIANERGTVHVVCNGEIYNQAELRRELEARGHRFRTHSDTEVLVHLYEDEGEGLMTHLNGMFALAIWDAEARRLLVARDRVGVKPLFYARVGDSLVFASEIKALLAWPGLSAQPRPEAIDAYLSLRYSAGPETMLRGVQRLTPGTGLSVDADAGSVRAFVYWEPWKQPPRGAGEGSLEDHVQRTRELLDDAVRIRLMSDVPFGAFLSGGLDSSGVVACMARHMEEPVDTFAIRFSEEPRLDEGEEARAVARHCGTRHHEVDCTAQRVDLLPRLLWHLDEPFADPIIVPTHQVSEFARERVKVVLTGEGADELFGGYTRFVTDAQIRRLARLPAPLRRRLARLARTLGATEQLARALDLAGMPPARRALSWVEAFDPVARAALYADPSWVGDSAEQLYAETAAAAPGSHPLETLLFCELRLRLPDCMLARTDRMTMAVSLEGRTPFLDYRLVEHALWMPHRFKVRGRSEKDVLKRALAPLLPARTSKRKKQGLAVPFAQWTRYGVEAPIRRILSPERVRRRGLFRPEAVADLLDCWGPHAARHSQMIWSLLCLELWFRMYVDSGADRVDPSTPLTQVE